MGITSKKTTDEFINDAKKVHGNTYIYDKVMYINSKTKIKITCPIHGEFEQIPNNHLKGARCFECKIDMLSKLNKHTTKEFVIKARLVHGDIYNYDNSEYYSTDKKIKITCPIHGEFEQTPASHLRGSKCPQCAKIISADKISESKLKTLDIFIEDAKKVHGDTYSYDNSKYNGSDKKIKITCPIHGEFEQTPSIHLRGSGCNKCGIIKVTNSLDYLNERCFNVHGDKYKYDFSNYKNNVSKIDIFCEKHGWFKQRFNNHCDLKQQCPSCKTYRSKGEIEIYDFINSLSVNVINNVKNIIDEEIDIFLPELNIGIEYDGEYWHSNHNKEDKCEYNKMIKCDEKDIFLIIFREQEWKTKEEIIKSMIKSKIGKINNKIHGRKCKINIVEKKEKSSFLKNNHIQGNCGSAIDLGLFHNDELVSLMSFSKLRKNMGSNNLLGHYELVRFCNILNTNVIGGFSKLLNFFIKNYTPKEIISYANRRWSQGNVYKNNGFEFVRDSPPSYKYLINNKLIDRFNFRKDILVSMGYDANKTEKEIMKELGHPLLYDCGNKVYKLKINK